MPPNRRYEAQSSASTDFPISSSPASTLFGLPLLRPYAAKCCRPFLMMPPALFALLQRSLQATRSLRRYARQRHRPSVDRVLLILIRCKPSGHGRGLRLALVTRLFKAETCHRPCMKSCHSRTDCLICFSNAAPSTVLMLDPAAKRVMTARRLSDEDGPGMAKNSVPSEERFIQAPAADSASARSPCHLCTLLL
ncbi:hypothetical protein BDY17DRAFT_36484 [Neohortaea acidophila]|uniref:Uncharacterized protein n=1 Tax=Neohortaea acidophila TaxID=245834 RepID=A0A6A6PKL2_9PEZI|nr:uncharacterized protein BDY17DRAFT_36484 [Neohortaea acidophila]KAF2480346.1 hypothetical protein BDY17DRAFT_36484 [Neohortaea acidophila]